MRELWDAAGRRAWAPEVLVRGDYGDDYDRSRSYDETFISGDTPLAVRPRSQRRADGYAVSLGLTWDLGDAVFNLDRIDVSREARLVIQLRDDVLDEVNQLYFERQRVLASLDAPPRRRAGRAAARCARPSSRPVSTPGPAAGSASSSRTGFRRSRPPRTGIIAMKSRLMSRGLRGRRHCMCWLAAPLGAHALPLISEVFYDAVGTDDGLSFVELYGAPGTDLDGCVVEGINGTGGTVTDTHRALGRDPGRRPVRDRRRAGRRHDARLPVPT